MTIAQPPDPSRAGLTAAIDVAVEAIRDFLAHVDERPVRPADPDATAAALEGDLPPEGEAPDEVVRHLVAAVEPGLTASTGPRFFGFVTGGALPAALAAELLASAWDQNAALHVMSPAMAAVEATAARWVLQALDLPATAGVGFVTGATAANVVGLAAGRHRLLADVGWDVEEQGLQGAPPLRLLCGAEVHASLLNAAQMVGLGRATWTRVAADDQGRMDPAALREQLAAHDGPTLVAAQAGNVNSGAVDPLAAIADACHAHGAWLHVDGAFGLWARASARRAHLVEGAERADSWAVDGHKWLNVPYDSGIAIVADQEAHRAAMAIGAAYLLTGHGRDGMDWVPESSRRARGLAVYAALRSLGRRGVAELVDRCCDLARRFADHLAAAEGLAVRNDVVGNQVVVTGTPPEGEDPMAFRDRFQRAIQDDGTCWIGGTVWRGEPALRISVSSWRTTAHDIDRSAEAVIAAHRHLTTTT